MTIAELFVNLGVKGADVTGKALKGVKTGLEETKSMSLEAKAAIIGVIYGLERMMSASAQQGANLLNFNSLTGLSVQRLQEWQYAARQASVSSEELTGSVKAVQNSMTNMLLGKGAPEGLAMLANKVGFDKNRARDTFYVMEQLQKFAKSAPPDVTGNLMKSFGLSEGVISAMQRNAFRPDVFAKAPKYSDNEVGSLQKVDVAWANIGNKIQMAMGHLTASKGLGIVSEISKLTDEVLKMVNAFAKLEEKLHLIEKAGMIFEGWTDIFKGITDLASGKVSAKDVLGGTGEAIQGALTTGKEAIFGKDYQPAGNQNVNNSITMNFQHDGKDAHKTASELTKAVNKVYRGKTAQKQVN